MKKNRPLRLVYLGTPAFAVPCLQALIQRGEHIAAVVSQPDRPAGRGRKMRFSAVKTCALEHGLAVLQPRSVKDPAFFNAFRALAPDLAVVVAYGQIIPRALLDVPAHGFINVHASLLPAYRGAAPINRAIIDGQSLSGVTIMQLDEGLDTGEILLKKKLSIEPDDTAATLHDRLSLLGAELLGTALDLLREDAWQPVAQDHTRATYAPVLRKQEGLIAWSKDARSIVNQVRGMTPWPGCFTYLHSRLLKVHRVRVRDKDPGAPPGTVVRVAPEGIDVAAGANIVVVEELQIEGRKRLRAADFIKGNTIVPGARLSTRRISKVP